MTNLKLYNRDFVLLPIAFLAISSPQSKHVPSIMFVFVKICFPELHAVSLAVTDEMSTWSTSLTDWLTSAARATLSQI